MRYGQIGAWKLANGSTTWKAALWVTASVAIANVVAAFFIFPPDIATTADRRVDWIGAALVTVGLILLQYTISSAEGAPDGWKTSCKSFIPS